MGKTETITLEPIRLKRTKIFIDGDSDLVLNKMNARAIRSLTGERSPGGKKVSEVPNIWEDVITAIHWCYDIPVEDTYRDCTEELLREMLKTNAPCISAFGLKKSFGQAVVRNEIDKYATKFDNAVNILADDNLVPITFAQYHMDEKLMSPKRGAPVLVRLNRFSGWHAEFIIQYTEHVYTTESIVNIINLAGFGLGIGSGRSSGYGRYHVAGVE